MKIFEYNPNVDMVITRVLKIIKVCLVLDI